MYSVAFVFCWSNVVDPVNGAPVVYKPYVVVVNKICMKYFTIFR